MARKISMRRLLFPVWLAFFALAYGQQAQQIEWQRGTSFTAADRDSIPKLAKIMGLLDPKRVYQGTYIPTYCPYVMVESTYSESDHLRTYHQLTVHRADWKCKPEGVKSKRVGRWLAYDIELETRREWKIEEGQWIKYVSFEDGVSYEDAHLIILAIRHHQVVNRLGGNTEVPTIDPAEITSIRVKSDADRRFEVTTSTGGSGEIYVVKINQHLVELEEVRVWIA